MTSATTVPRRSRPRVSGPERVQLARRIAADYERGASIRQIAVDVDASYGFVHRLLTDSLVVLRGRGGKRRPRH